MSAPVLPFLLPGFAVDAVRTVDMTLLVEAHSATAQATCPTCQQPSLRVHSRYFRTPRDLPVSEHPIRLLLHVRRFFCDNPACSRRTFAERLPNLLPVRAQRTIRLTHTLQIVANALGGKAGARLATKLRIGMSHDTLLRLIRQSETVVPVTPRVLGVDDFALQKGRIYGTILVDLEQHQPIDLLPDRTADTFAAGLRDHPGVEVIARDRSTEYARGATDGAPAALQVADRWHVLKNHREALERMLGRLHADLTRLPELLSTADTHLVPPPQSIRPLRLPSMREQAVRQVARDRRLARYQQVQALYQQGVSMVQIATRLGMGRATVRKFVAAAVFPERAVQRRQPSMLDPYVPYLQQRRAEGCTNASQLWREIAAQGYPGVRKQVARWVQQQRIEPAPTGPKKYHSSTKGASHTLTERATPAAAATPPPALQAPRRLVWLLLRSPSQLDKAETATFNRIQQHPEVAHAQTLAQEFQAMVRQRRPEVLDEWLAACMESGISELQSFATGLQREYSSIRAALSEPWTTGQVEGQITRVKLLKRQMYGRAKFDLLKQRVLQRA
jgi:transposase